MKHMKRSLFCLLFVATIPSLPAQPFDGAALFQQHCNACHSGEANSRAPAREMLATRGPQAILVALSTGSMRVQGAKLSGLQRRTVAEFLTGRKLEGDVSGASRGRCAASMQLADSVAQPSWNGWGPDVTNTRFQTGNAAGLTAAQVPRLALKWAFGFPDASSAWAQPSVSHGRVWVGSQNGTVYSLDAKSGCIYWTFSAAGGVRTRRTGPLSILQLR